MNGIEHETIEFHKALIGELRKINTNLEKIAEELSFRNDMEYPKTRSDKNPLDNY